MTDISAEELLQRAMAAVGRYRKVQRTVVYGQKAKVHILWEGFVEDLLQNRPSPRQRGISGGFICYVSSLMLAVLRWQSSQPSRQ